METLKHLIRNDVHRGWKNDSLLRRNKFGSFYPVEDFKTGDNGPACDESKRSVCKVDCCSSKLTSYTSPLEIILISEATNSSPYSFVNPTSPKWVIFDGKGYGITTPFSMKIENEYCVFNEMPVSGKCSYDHRPLQCRSFPLDYDKWRGLIQRKGCPGFKKGKVLTEEEILKAEELGKTSILLDGVQFSVDDYKNRNLGGVGRYIWENMDIDPNKVVREVTKDSFHNQVENVKRISNLGEEMKEMGVEQDWFERYMINSFKQIS